MMKGQLDLSKVMAKVEQLGMENAALTRQVKGLEKRVTESEEEIKSLKDIAELSGSKRKAEIMSRKTSIRYALQDLYRKTVYHMLDDSFDAYRLASTDLIQVNGEKKESKTRKIAEFIAKGASKVLGSIPLFGKIADAAEDVLEWQKQRVNKKAFGLDMEAVCSFMRYNNSPSSDLEEDFGLTLYNAARELAIRREQDILEAANPRNIQKLKESESFFEKFWDAISGEDTPEMPLDEKAVRCLAIKDVSVILAHIFRFSRQMIKSKDTIEEQFVKIVMDVY